MSLRLRSPFTGVSVIAIACVMGLWSSPGFAEQKTNVRTPSRTVLAEPAVIRLYVEDSAHLNAVAGRLDIWESHPDESYVLARVTPAQYEWLADLGYRIEIDVEKAAAMEARAALDPRFHFFDDYNTNANGLYVTDFLEDINTAYPELTELYDIGDAWLAGQPGQHHRDLWVLRITNEDPAYGLVEDKPVFYLFATIHAREVAIPELAMRYIRYLTDGYDGEGGYGLDPDVTWLLDHNVAYVQVMQNPDGHWKDELDVNSFWRKNLNSTHGCSISSWLGVDLNRNHSFLWNCCGGSSSDPCDETYRGPTAGSEPETQAFQDYFATVMQDQNGPNGDNELPPAAPDDTTGIFISLHSYSDLVLWPWGFDDFGASPNHDQMQTIGRKFAYYNGYNASGSIYYAVDGATDDWVYGKFGVPSYTFEVGPAGGACYGFFPPYGCIDGIDGMPRNFWAENKPALLYAHKIARTPYMTTYGPDTQSLRLTPGSAYSGETVQLVGTIGDNRLAGDTLQFAAGAEYFIDVPGVDGTGIAMAPVDGVWGDDMSEAGVSPVDTFGLSVGQHYILVHGQSENGDWGPFTAVFLDITCTANDFDCNGVTNLSDYSIFADCMAGPGNSVPPVGCTAEQFERADLDRDLDVDFADYAVFELTYVE